MKPKLKLGIIGVILIVIGVVGSVVIANETRIQVIEEITVEKTFSNNDVEITYEVGVENGIEETPPPDVIEQMSQSYTPEQQEEIKLSPEYQAIIEDKRRVLEERLGNSYAAKKQDIDSTFTCENYNELAYKYRGQAYAGFYIKDKYDGTFEGYIYNKAFHECIDPKYDEKYDKVFEELEKVYED